MIIHAAILFLAIGPFNLYTDSLGYLETADKFYDSHQWVYNHSRPVGLPFLYLFLLWAAQYKIAFVVIFQIICFYGSIVLSVAILFRKLTFALRNVIITVIVLLSLRTFLYCYMILSEALFSCALVVFCTFVHEYLDTTDMMVKRRNLNVIYICAVAIAFIKSIGMLFLAISICLYIYHYCIQEKRKLIFVIPLVLLALSLSVNKQTQGVFTFSRQEGIQLLISANRFINYDTSYMIREKLLIKSSHEQMLKRFSPRTRLDQMIGPVEGIETPAEILGKDSIDYEDYNNKLKNIVMEGLLVDGDWFWYALDGLWELKKMVINDDKEGTISPVIVGDFNQPLLNNLNFLKRYNSGERLKRYNAIWSYYMCNAHYMLLPKCVSFVLFVILFVFILAESFRINRTIKISPICLVFAVCVSYLYLSALLVFALDRYYAGIETVFWLLSFFIIIELRHSYLSPDVRRFHRTLS